MKYLKTTLSFFVMLSSLNIYGIDVPKSTENAGMNKYERINHIEKELIKLSMAFELSKYETKELKRQFKEQIRENKELRKKLLELQEKK